MLRRPVALLALLMVLVAPGHAAEPEPEAEPFLVLPDAAQRVEARAECLAALADPAAAIDGHRLVRLALALAQDGDRPVGGFQHLGSASRYTAVDARAPDGTSRRDEALVLVRQAL